MRDLKTCDIVLVSVNSPALLGIYQNNKLICEFKESGKSSDILPKIFNEVIKNYKIENIFYANGPGNFSAIKLTHIFLQTLNIVNGISLFCADSFTFSDDKFINAYGKIHFFKENGEIKSTRLKERLEAKFKLPKEINKSLFHQNCTPLYILPAV
ncbi:MAG: hypothetical protein K2P17_03915 [Helicobacteraceae bacterium]|nr:hypothetical protein [Helicobacteraceae bacterium]